MKRLLLSLAMVLALAAPSFAAEDIVVGVTPFPHKDIMLAAKPLLAKEGYNLVIKEFTDYVQPNMALASKQLFANFFQHEPYLDNMNKEKNLGLVSIGKVHIEPLGVYSKKIKKLAELKKGDADDDVFGGEGRNGQGQNHGQRQKQAFHDGSLLG